MRLTKDGSLVVDLQSSDGKFKSCGQRQYSYGFQRWDPFFVLQSGLFYKPSK